MVNNCDQINDLSTHFCTLFVSSSRRPMASEDVLSKVEEGLLPSSFFINKKYSMTGKPYKERLGFPLKMPILHRLWFAGGYHRLSLSQPELPSCHSENKNWCTWQPSLVYCFCLNLEPCVSGDCTISSLRLWCYLVRSTSPSLTVTAVVPE